MNPREKSMLIGLVAVLGCGLLALLTYFWFVVPFKANKARIAMMADELDKKVREVEDFKAEKVKLVRGRLKSLPASKTEAATVYMGYLNPLMSNCGLEVLDLTKSDPVEVKPVTQIPNVKKTGHQMMSFQVRAKGTLGALVMAMERLRSTPYEHRIKRLQINRADVSKDGSAHLIIDMTIEALLVAKTESKPGLPPGIDVKWLFADSLTAQLGGPPGLGQALASVVLQQAEPALIKRNYADIAKRDFFAGALSIEAGRPALTPAEIEMLLGRAKYPGPVPSQVRVVTIDSKKEEAKYINLWYGKDEFPLAPGKTFLIQSDATPAYVFLLGKVLRIDSRDVFFQVKDKVYQWHIGDTLEHATRRALADDYMDAIDLEPDYAWGKVELEKEDTAPPPAKKKGGGFNRGR